MSESFSLFLNNQEFLIPRDFELLLKFPKRVSSQLVSQFHYNVESKVPSNIFQTFIDYLKDNSKIPTINSDNLYEYRLLSKEFNFLSEYTMKPELDPVYHVSLLKKAFTDSINDNANNEEYIAKNLDMYLEKYPDEISSIPLPSLYNIFFHNERKLDDHNRAYEIITKSGNVNLSILLESLDGSKMSFDMLNDSIKKKEEHFGFMPKIDLETVINSKVSEIKEKNDQTIKNLTEKHKNEISQLTEKLQKIESEMTSKIDQINKEKENEKRLKQEQENERYQIECNYTNNELSGIISYLKNKTGSQPILTGGGKTSSKHPITSLIQYDREHINDYYFNYYNIVASCNDNWIEFDFRERRVKVTSYTIRTSSYSFHPRSWAIVGSNGNDGWPIIDEQEENSVLNGECKQHRFKCKNESKYYRRIRYIQKNCWGSNKPFNIYLTCIEFFGSIVSPTPLT